jgi:HK97 family phage major capsid protein
MKMLAKLIQERADLVKEAKGIFAAADQEGRPLTDEEKARDDEINARLQAIAPDIERLERQQERERTMTAVSVHGIEEVRDRVEDDPKRGFKSTADFAVAVRAASRPNGAVDERLLFQAQPTGYHRETGSDEGYMVPPAMRDEIWDLVVQRQELLNLMTAEPTSSNAVDMVADETTPWGSAGVKAAWRAEGEKMTPSRLATQARTVRLHELYAFVLATEELLQDAPRLNDRLTRRAAEAITWTASAAIFEGDGVGKPLGFMKGGSLVVQAKEGSQTATTIVGANVAKMYSRLLPGAAARAFWLIAPDAFPALATMTIGDQPVWFPDFRAAPGGVLLGRPVYPSFHCETLGAEGDIVLVAPDGYYLVRRTDSPQFASSIHLYFDYNMQAFRWTFRLGGQPFLSDSVSPAKGSSKLSHFVTLAIRS